jgi:hypothetical protein
MGLNDGGMWMRMKILDKLLGIDKLHKLEDRTDHRIDQFQAENKEIITNMKTILKIDNNRSESGDHE